MGKPHIDNEECPICKERLKDFIELAQGFCEKCRIKARDKFNSMLKNNYVLPKNIRYKE